MTANRSVSVSALLLVMVNGLALIYDQIDPPIVGTEYYNPAAGYFAGVRARTPSNGTSNSSSLRSALAFYQFGQSLASLFAALIGGLAARLLAR